MMLAVNFFWSRGFLGFNTRHIRPAFILLAKLVPHIVDYGGFSTAQRQGSSGKGSNLGRWVEMPSWLNGHSGGLGRKQEGHPQPPPPTSPPSIFSKLRTVSSLPRNLPRNVDTVKNFNLVFLARNAIRFQFNKKASKSREGIVGIGCVYNRVWAQNIMSEGLINRIRGDHTVGLLGMLKLCHDLTTGLQRVSAQVVSISSTGAAGAGAVVSLQKDVALARGVSEDLRKLVTDTADMLEHPVCQSLGCPGTALNSWRKPGMTGQLCSIHRMKGMVAVQSVVCQFTGCAEAPLFDFPGPMMRNRFCLEHKLKGMYRIVDGDDMTIDECEAEGCPKRAVFTLEGKKKHGFCADHAQHGMILMQSTLKEERKRRKLTCEEEGCKKSPYYNFKGEKVARFCNMHSLEGMVNIIIKKRCEHPDCSSVPSFNFQGQRGSRFCVKHKLDGMICINRKFCEAHNCKSSPVWRFKGEVLRFCSKHKLPGMVSLETRRCEEDGCQTLANYNFKGERKRRFCFKHKSEGMISFVRPNPNRKKSALCLHGGCPTSASFNYEGGRRGQYCAKHRLDGMVNVVSQRCDHPGCHIQPRYNYPGVQPPLACTHHKRPGMVIVKRFKLCEVPGGGCERRRRYGYPGQPYARCHEHKLPGMVLPPHLLTFNRSRPTCEHPECEKQPTQGFEGMKVRFCGTHKLDGMTCIAFKKCEYVGCKKIPTWNYRGERGRRFCATHKLDGMVQCQREKMLCERCGEGLASYNYEGQKKGRFCGLHKVEGMVNVATLKCKHPGCMISPCYNFEDQKTGKYCVAHKEEGMIYIRRRSKILAAAAAVKEMKWPQ